MLEIKDYIAGQINAQGLDELQRMTLAAVLGKNIALDGPPGVGKTQSVLALARILNRELFDKGCSEDTTESQIIGFPVLEEKNGATVSVYENGPLTKAMARGGIFYGDEFNLLKKDKQKRLNSAFDDRRTIRRGDDVEVAALEGFLGVISYNPSRNLSFQDLEDSVADRFVHLNYRYMSAGVEAYISVLGGMENSGKPPEMKSFGIKLQKRVLVLPLGGKGSLPNEKSSSVTGKSSSPTGTGSSINIDSSPLILGYLDPSRKSWMNFFTHQPLNLKSLLDTHQVAVYSAAVEDEKSVVKDGSSSWDAASESAEFSKKITGLFTLIRSMMNGGSSSLPEKVRRAIFQDGVDAGQLNVHPPSLRILTSAVSLLNLVRSLGMDKTQAFNFCAELVVDQICYGKFRTMKNGDFENRELVVSLCGSLGFQLDKPLVFNTRLKKTI